VHLEISADIAEHDQAGKRVLLRGFDLAAIFPQFGWKPVQPHGSEDILFFAAPDSYAFFFAGILGLLSLRQAKNSVLADSQPALDTELADRNVVRLGTGKVNQRRSITMRGTMRRST
jgi:hypothetical protein